MVYKDFVIQFDTEHGGTARAKVTRSPTGQSTYVLLDHTSIIEYINDQTKDFYAEEEEIVSDLFHRGIYQSTVDEIGKKLFKFLFEGEIKARFEESWGIISQDPNLGLRIKLRFDLRESKGPIKQLAGIPWEILKHPEKNDFLSQSKRTKRTPIVRYLDVPRAEDLHNQTLIGPLRVLCVLANPTETSPLELSQEREILQKIFAKQQNIEIDILEQATLKSLQQKLSKHDYHVLHFMGHGYFDKEKEEGGILLETDEGSAQKVSGKQLQKYLMDEPTLRLVFLNACDTGKGSELNSGDSFVGVASALVWGGIPSVVAMQFPISDQAAIAFSEMAYFTLALGRPIDEAVAEGRKAIIGSNANSTEWLTPVLFLRSADGHIFDITSARVVKQSSSRNRPATLLPYMVNRKEVCRLLRDMIREQNAEKSKPILAIIHGENEQCMDKLLQRFKEDELPAYLKLRSLDVGITDFHMDWPREFGNKGEFHKRLTSALAEKIDPMFSREELHTYFRHLPSPVLIHSHMAASEWSRFRNSDIFSTFVDYWSNWPRQTGSQRMIVLLFIKYEKMNRNTSLRTLFSRSSIPRSTREIGKELDVLAQTQVDHLFLKVMPQLRRIVRQDLLNWATTHKPHLIPHIDPLFEQLQDESGTNEITMQRIAKSLENLIEEYDYS